MGYGQYSAGGGLNRTKADMLPFATGEIATSRKGGKNRLHFTRTDGSQGFILHKTIVAECSADKTRVTLADGGWHTPTTKSAWCDAIAAFDLPKAPRYFTPYSSQPDDDDDDGFRYGDLHNGLWGYWTDPAPRIGRPTRDERSVTFVLGDDGAYHVATDVVPDHPMLRADVDYSNFAVRFTGEAIVSESGASARCTPFKALCILLRIDALAKATTKYHTMRGDALYQFSFDALGYTIHPGQTSRSMMVGCHTFATRDVRAFMRAIAALHPDAFVAAKRFVRKHPTDFGVKAYEAEQARRYAALRAA